MEGLWDFISHMERGGNANPRQHKGLPRTFTYAWSEIHNTRTHAVAPLHSVVFLIRAFAPSPTALQALWPPGFSVADEHTRCSDVLLESR